MRKKMMIVVCIILVVAVVVLIALIWITKISVVDKNGMVNYREYQLTGVRYSSSGSMEGGYHYIELLPDENGQLWLMEEQQLYNGSEIKTKRIQATPEDLNQIKQLCVKYRALILGELTYSDLILLDAATDSVSFYLENYEIITISSQHELPEESMGIIYAVYQSLTEMLQK